MISYMQNQSWQTLKINAIIKIQRYLRAKSMRRHLKNLIKDPRKRRLIIKQMVETQQKYIQDLSLVISDFKMSLLSRKIISQEDADIIFSNIDQIRRLNELFFATIFNLAENYTHYKIIFDKVEKEIHFFKIYFQYFNNYELSESKINYLMNHNSRFQEFVKGIRINPKYHLLTLRDFLIKPVQRLPKYVLIMKEIRRMTPADHPDSRNIDRVLQMFQEVNHSNNEKLNQVVNRYKIGEIERDLVLPHVISQPGVQFILQEPVTILTEENQLIQCTMYLLNTEIIISRVVKNKEIFVTSVPFKNGGGNIMQNEDSFFYKNYFTVQNGEGDSCTFKCQSEEEKENLIQKIYSQLVKAEMKNLQKLASLCSVKNKQNLQFLKERSRLDLLPEVQILGTEERNSSLFKYTIYIIEVRIKSIRQKIFLRYSQLLQIQQHILEEYDINIKNTLLQTNWLLNHKPKKIEERKMNIQRFLKEILSKRQIIQDGQSVLQMLTLPIDFYDLPERYREAEQLHRKRSVMSQRSTGSHSGVPYNNEKSEMDSSKRVSIFQNIMKQNDSFLETKKSKFKSKRQSIQDILLANQIKSGHFNRYTELIQPRMDDEVIIVGVLIPNIESPKGFLLRKIDMRTNQKVFCLIQKLAQKIGLKCYKDFRLYLQRDYAGRLLDNDQYLPKVIEEMNFGKFRLIFKKMIYVIPQTQEAEIRNDRVRLNIIASQIIYECKRGKYLLSYNSILKLSILVGITQYFKSKNFDQVDQIDFNDLKTKKIANSTRDMVSNQYTLFCDGEETWQKDYLQTFSKIYLKLRQIGKQNLTYIRDSNIKNIQQEHNTTNISQLAAISIIMQIKDNIFFGSVSYIVQMSQQFRTILCKINNKQNDYIQNINCWLIIKYSKIYLYSICLANCIFSFQFSDILRIEPYSSSILVYFRGREVDYITLQTSSSYNIRELLRYYKNYNEMINKMQASQKYQESMMEQVSFVQNKQSILRRTILNQ